jgi:hypothetical protein
MYISNKHSAEKKKKKKKKKNKKKKKKEKPLVRYVFVARFLLAGGAGKGGAGAGRSIGPCKEFPAH